MAVPASAAKCKWKSGIQNIMRVFLEYLRKLNIVGYTISAKNYILVYHVGSVIS